MKNLIKIPRNFSAKFCWQEKPKQANEVSENLVKGDLNTLNQQVKQTPESNEYSSQKTIDASLTAAKNGEKIPTGFEKIKASEFLKRSAEELQTLFIDSTGIVNFRGNPSARRYIGLSDLFPKVSDKPQYVVLDGVSYAYGARRGDGKIGYGNPKYKSILGGEKIEFFIGSPVQDENGKSRENFVSFVKDEKGETTPPSKEYSYKALSNEFEKSYKSKKLENLTQAEEKATKNEFLQELQTDEKLGITLVIPEGKENMSLSAREKFAMNYFINKAGYTKAQAAGLVGNLKAESNLNPYAVGDGGKAFGIAQWHPNRQSRFNSIFGKDIRQASFGEQLAFVAWELRNTEKKADHVLRNADNAATAAAAVDKHYERSSGAHRQKRINLATNIKNKYDNIA